MCERYSGKAGGYEATKLSMYPLMLEILQRLEAAAEVARTPAADRVPNFDKVSLLSGHDTVIAPILASLLGDQGMQRFPRFCRWPSYASVITFELWAEDKPILTQSDFSTRVVFNGESITPYIGGCGGGALCSLSGFRRHVQSLLGGKETIQDACVYANSHI